MSDLLYTVPNIPHLRNIRLVVAYRELIEKDEDLTVWRSAQKWKQDPDANRFGGYFGPPRYQYYVNGVKVGEEVPQVAQTSSTPFPEKQVPRRGLLQVFPDDPDYRRICIEQGLEHLVSGYKEALLPNGADSPATSQAADTPATTAPGTADDSKDDDAVKEMHEPHPTINGNLLNGLVNGSGV